MALLGSKSFLFSLEFKKSSIPGGEEKKGSCVAESILCQLIYRGSLRSQAQKVVIRA